MYFIDKTTAVSKSSWVFLCRNLILDIRKLRYLSFSRFTCTILVHLFYDHHVTLRER
jgi:hypothetical protein